MIFMNRKNYLCYFIFIISGCSYYSKKDAEHTSLENQSNKYQEEVKKEVALKTENPNLILLDYKMLAKDSLKYFEYTNLRNSTKTTLYRDSADYDQYYTLIDKEYKIEMYNFSPQKPDYNSPAPWANHDRDYMKIAGKKFIFDQIISEKSYPHWDLRPFTNSVDYLFYFNGRRYFAAFFCSSTASTHPNLLLCLFDLTTKVAPELIFFEYQASFDIHCLGDFNQDGNLDFASRDQLGNKLICKTLKNNKFEEIEGYYLTIVDSPHEPKIDLDKSKWFFDLGEK